MKVKYSDLKNKRVFITGGGSGIGGSIVEHFCEQGSEVYFIDIKVSEAEKLIEDIKNKKYSIPTFIECDLLNIKQLQKTIADIIDQKGPIDILINNAGITGPTGPLWEYDVDMWNKIVQINLMGTFNCCRAIVPNMIKNNYGRIVNVASVAGKDGNANASAYSSGKAGAIGLTKALGKELADKDIAVNAVTPAGAKTRILDQMSKEHVQRMLSKVPRGRFLEIHEFTSLVCWLSSQENTFSTAAVFDISGGRSTY